MTMAAKKFRAGATGVKLDDDLWEQSSADLLTVYLLPGSNDKLRPLANQPRKGRASWRTVSSLPIGLPKRQKISRMTAKAAVIRSTCAAARGGARAA